MGTRVHRRYPPESTAVATSMRPKILLPCLLLASTGCASAPATPPDPTPSRTMTDHPPETRFATPDAYPDAVAAAGAAFDPARYRVPDVQGLRLGTFAGMPALLVDAHGSRAAIAVHGGHLLSWVPEGGKDVLWLSPALAQAPAAIRGGVPVVWPFFGRQGQGDDVPSHGFARTVRWQVETARRESDGSVRLTLAPPALDGLALTLRMELHIGTTLEQTLVTTSTGDVPVVFTQALHSYFRVSDVHRVRVEGLDGLRFLDKNDGYAEHPQAGDWLLDDARDPGRSDYVYRDAPGRYVLDDPALDRRIELTTEGSRSLVVWNPGEVSAERSTDMRDGAWRGFLCLEAANAGPDRVVLAPGATHALTQHIRVLPRD